MEHTCQKCEVCVKSFALMKDLKKHMTTKHPGTSLITVLFTIDSLKCIEIMAIRANLDPILSQCISSTKNVYSGHLILAEVLSARNTPAVLSIN